MTVVHSWLKGLKILKISLIHNDDDQDGLHNGMSAGSEAGSIKKERAARGPARK